MIRTEKYWPIKEIVKFIHQRLQLCGVGRDDAAMYSEHYIKQGFEKLWCSLGLTDDHIQ